MKGKLIDVTYVGRHGLVLVDPDGFGEVLVAHGETIKIPEVVALSLLEQPANWALKTAEHSFRRASKTNTAVEEATN